MTQVYEVGRQVVARIPTDFGQFQLALYHNSADDKEHLALIFGEVSGGEDVLVRVHSECFTGDVLGSNRCDCGEQLHLAMERIATEERGVIVYLRQEGRGIGLLEKLRAYNLQDEGYDTVDANLLLGHAEDEREYSAAAAILADLGVKTIRLLTNNPTKVESLTDLGVNIAAREPLAAQHITADTAMYLKTKVERMRHLLDLAQVDNGRPFEVAENGYHAPDPLAIPFPEAPQGQRPFVTLSYAQTLDGSIAAQPGTPLAISGPQSLMLTHQLRAAHAGILVGIGTVLADDPRLNVRLVPGRSPRPIILDSQLRLPPTARVVRSKRMPIVAGLENAPDGRRAELEAAGALVLSLPPDKAGQVALPALLERLQELGIDSLMVEGGAQVIGSFLADQLVDGVVLTLSPQLLGGVKGVERPLHNPPRLRDSHSFQLGEDLIVWGRLAS